MESYSDSDSTSESDYESGQGSTPSSDSDNEEPTENLEPDFSETIYDEFNDALWNPQAQLDTTCLA
jgi:hypothetical protein